MFDVPRVPEGYRIEREEARESTLRLPAEVKFTVVLTAGDREITCVRAREDRRSGAWSVSPGSQCSGMEAAEARARSAALLMAAEEVDRRNRAAT